MALVGQIIDTFSLLLRHGNDDYVDRFHYFYTVIGFSVYLLWINSNIYMGPPLVCMDSFNDDFNKYAQSM